MTLYYFANLIGYFDCTYIDFVQVKEKMLNYCVATNINQSSDLTSQYKMSFRFK